MPHPIRCVAALALIALGALAGSPPATPGDLATDPAPAPGEVVQLEGSLTVLAAASLTEVFRSLGTAFEAVHPAVEVTFSFGGSSALAQWSASDGTALSRAMKRWPNSRPKASEAGSALPSSAAPSCSSPWAALSSEACTTPAASAPAGTSASRRPDFR